MPTVPAAVVVLDENAERRAGLCALVERRCGLQVVGPACDRAQAIAIIARARPCIVVLDLDSAGGLGLLGEIHAAVEGVRAVVLTALRDPGRHYRALRLGAMGLVAKDRVVESLGTALEEVLAGRAWLDGGVMAGVLARLAHGDPGDTATVADIGDEAALTRREQQIVDLVIRGLGNRKIADRLFMSEGTVRNHLTAIFRKLGLATRCELIAYARGFPQAEPGLCAPRGLQSLNQ